MLVLSAKYDSDVWEHTYFPKEGNGYLVTEIRIIKEANSSKREKEKFYKELHMCKVLADNGCKVEFLHGVERPKGQTYYIILNGIKTDLKSVTGMAGNIVKYAKKIYKKAGIRCRCF